MSENTTPVEPSLAVTCSLSEQDLAHRSQEVGRELFASAEQVEELPDGYIWRFPGHGDWHPKLLEFVAAERHCCGFFRIELAFAPSLGPVTLSLRGPEGTKAFISKVFVT
jgi:hypothetical protein